MGENTALEFLRNKCFCDHGRLDIPLKQFQVSCYLALGDFYMQDRVQHGAFVILTNFSYELVISNYIGGEINSYIR